jgi:hypothetical protein
MVALQLGVVVIDTSHQMPAYEIYFNCNECKREHPIHLKIHLDYGPKGKQSLTHFFCDRSMPPQVTSIRGRKVFCLKTGKILKLENDEQIFLVPPYDPVDP